MNAREKMCFLYGLLIANEKDEETLFKFAETFQLIFKSEFPEFNCPEEEDDSVN
jgi:hypothetical protein|tara:strand:+ start:235 stop:396 length:162 start_codon:yes stop_codon:yes gene_type:complete